MNVQELPNGRKGRACKDVEESGSCDIQRGQAVEGYNGDAMFRQ